MVPSSQSTIKYFFNTKNSFDASNDFSQIIFDLKMQERKKTLSRLKHHFDETFLPKLSLTLLRTILDPFGHTSFRWKTHAMLMYAYVDKNVKRKLGA